MSNPFESAEGTFRVLINEEEQYSLWPATMEAPDGWSSVFGADTREACLAFVDEQWTDMRPRSLRAASNAS